MSLRNSTAMQVQMARRAMAKAVAFAFLLFAGWAASTNAAEGQAKSAYELRGERLTARFEVVHGGLKVAEVVNRKSGAKLLPGEAFSLQLRDGRVIAASQMKMSAAPLEEQIAANRAAPSAAERVAGRRVCADLSEDDISLTVHWCAMLREGANYL